jgi:hypothetical protein
MSPFLWYNVRCGGTAGAVAAAMFYLAAAQAQPVFADEGHGRGRIDFEAAELPPPTVELDLSQGMFHDLFGLGDAAVAGVADSLLASQGDGAGATRVAAEQLAAARQIMQLASEVVREVRIRVYRGVADEKMKPELLAARFDSQLRAGKWDNVVRVRDDEQSVRVSLLRNDGAVHGVFIIAGHHGQEIVLANLVCDISPENVKKLTSAATKIGLENGLAKVIEAKMSKHHRFPAATPPVPPRPEQQ